jgi:hypothetical protein
LQREKNKREKKRWRREAFWLVDGKGTCVIHMKCMRPTKARCSKRGPAYQPIRCAGARNVFYFILFFVSTFFLNVSLSSLSSTVCVSTSSYKSTAAVWCELWEQSTPQLLFIRRKMLSAQSSR